MLSYSFLKETYLTFRTADKDTTDLIWWQIFRSCFDKITEASRLIINNPKRRLQTSLRYERAERMPYMPAELENEYEEFKDEPSHLYRMEEMYLSKDTIENRFLKYALNNIADRFKHVRKNVMKVLKADNVDMLNQIRQMDEELTALSNDPFFRGIGTFKGFTQDSLVMKQAAGYRDIYEQWIILQCGYDLQDGIMQLEVKDISELYEIWCFIKVKNIVQHILRNTATARVDGSKMEGDFIKALIQGSKSEVVFLDNEKPDVQLASVMYNATTDDEEHITDETAVSQNTDIAETTSKTTEQRPDIVLRLSKTDDKIQYTYLFDAKYRIRDTSIPAKNGVEVPPVSAINQLHRYRDAIYYTHASDEKLKREVIGGYVLYPGNLSKEDFTGSYYHKSVDEVNIGAYPLKPGGHWNHLYNDEGVYNEILLDPTSSYQQIEKWIMDDNAVETLLETSIPQKGLEYTDEPVIKGSYYLSLVDSHVNAAPELIKNGQSGMFISGYSSILSGVNFQKIKFFAPVDNHIVNGYYRVDSVEIVDMKDILQKELDELKSSGKTSKYKGFDKSIRICLKLSEYKPLDKPFTYGLDRNAAIGIALTRAQFKEYCKSAQ